MAVIKIHPYPPLTADQKTSIRTTKFYLFQPVMSPTNNEVDADMTTNSSGSSHEYTNSELRPITLDLTNKLTKAYEDHSRIY